MTLLPTRRASFDFSEPETQAAGLSPVRLAAGHNLFEVHNVRVATLLQHPDLPHGCDWDSCIKPLELVHLPFFILSALRELGIFWQHICIKTK